MLRIGATLLLALLLAATGQDALDPEFRAEAGRTELRYWGATVSVPASYVPAYAQTPPDGSGEFERELHCSLASLLVAFLQEGYSAFDVFAGWGLKYVPMSTAAGSTGALVVVEIEQFAQLKDNAFRGMWDRTLVIHGNPCALEQLHYPALGQLNAGPAYSQPVSLVAARIGLCPAVLTLSLPASAHGGMGAPQRLHYALLGSLQMIERCRPVVHVELTVQHMFGAGVGTGGVGAEGVGTGGTEGTEGGSYTHSIAADAVLTTAILDILSTALGGQGWGQGQGEGGYQLFWHASNVTLTEGGQEQGQGGQGQGQGGQEQGHVEVARSVGLLAVPPSRMRDLESVLQGGMYVLRPVLTMGTLGPPPPWAELVGGVGMVEGVGAEGGAEKAAGTEGGTREGGRTDAEEAEVVKAVGTEAEETDAEGTEAAAAAAATPNRFILLDHLTVPLAPLLRPLLPLHSLLGADDDTDAQGTGMGMGMGGSMGMGVGAGTGTEGSGTGMGGGRAEAGVAASLSPAEAELRLLLLGRGLHKLQLPFLIYDRGGRGGGEGGVGRGDGGGGQGMGQGEQEGQGQGQGGQGQGGQGQGGQGEGGQGQEDRLMLMLAEGRCFSLLEKLFVQLAVHTATSASNPTPTPTPWTAAYLLEERQHLHAACLSFSLKRVQLLSNLLRLQHLPPPAERAPTDVWVEVGQGVEAGLAGMGAEGEELRPHPQRQHSHYEYRQGGAGASGMGEQGRQEGQGREGMGGAEGLGMGGGQEQGGQGTGDGPWFLRAPFASHVEPDACGEPVWCSHTHEMQRRIRAWQFPNEPPPPRSIRGLSRRPDPDKITAKESERVSDWSYQRRSCAQSKFLVFEPPSHRHGLGSMLEVTATAFRYALCLDRILILNPIDYAPTLKKWAMPGCEGNPWECYFRPLSGCSLTPSEVTSAPVSSSGFDFDAYPLREEKVLVLRGLPTQGECAICHAPWSRRSRFFDGHFLGYTDFSGDLNYWHFSAFMGPTKAPWASQFLRFLMRPRPWFAEALMQYAHAGMRSPLLPPPSSAGDTYTPGAPLPLHFPQKFLSLHIRYGMKVVEQELQPVTRYMALISRKLPHLSDIFVSTESEFAINELISSYPEYRFHFLRYPRIELLDLGLDDPLLSAATDYPAELAYSMANLYVASEAGGFVGTLSSNWCMMIMHLERTRGDGGFDYLSLDVGSAHTSCF